MRITPSKPTIRVRHGPYYLAPFDNLMASVVATWARDASELFWLAPKTPPPLTAAKVVAWPGPQGSPMLFYRESESEPLGYFEINPMPGEKLHLWLGHCVVRPEERGAGLGRRMTTLMLEEVFCHRDAQRVSLVVFPDNIFAIACYRAVGFLDGATQIKYFKTSGRQHRMFQMSIDRRRYESITQPPVSK